MTRILVSVALAAVLAGCARSGAAVPQAEEFFPVDSALVAAAVETAYVVEEVPQEVPVYYTDTVYYEEEPAPAETVYVAEEYETVILVPEPVLPPHHHPRWHPNGREGRGRGGHGRGGQEEPGQGEGPGNGPRPKPEKPRPQEAKPLPPNGTVKPTPAMPAPPEPPKVLAQETSNPEKSPDKPDQPAPPKVSAPAKSDTVKIAPVGRVKPLPAPDKDDKGQIADARKKK